MTMQLNDLYAENVASKKLAMQEAEAAHAAAVAEADKLSQRVLSMTTRQSVITSNRITSGVLDQAEAAESLAIEQDLEVLRPMVAEAKNKALACKPDHARIELAKAEKALTNHVAESTHQALRARVAELDRALVTTAKLCYQAGREIGHHNPRESMTFSDDLKALSNYNPIVFSR